jgi:glycosyltransferase involved in cell wall biosynthesis
MERANGPIRIAHCPTNRAVKSTTRVLEAIQNLANVGYDLVFDLIERVPYDECLQRKAKADILVDQLELGIGNNSLEAFGMSIPVVAGVADPAVRQAMLAQWGKLPFYEANTSNLEERLCHLIRNRDLRAEWGAKGFEHLLTWHEEYKVVSQLADVYRRAMASTSLVEGVA